MSKNIKEDQLAEWLTQEMQDCFKHLDRQHQSVKWLVQVYFTASAAFLGIISFLYPVYLSKENQTAIGAFAGSIGAVLMFVLGWLLISSLASRIQSIILCHKHMACIRKARLVNFGTGVIKSYVFVSNAEGVRIPSFVSMLPIVVSAVNYTFLLGGIVLFWSELIGIQSSITVALAVGVVSGLFYPQAIVTFKKHIKAGTSRNTFNSAKIYERSFALCLHRSQKKWKWTYYAILGCFVLVVILACKWSIVIPYHADFYLKYSMVTTALFVLTRTFFEMHSIQQAKKRTSKRTKTK